MAGYRGRRSVGGVSVCYELKLRGEGLAGAGSFFLLGTALLGPRVSACCADLMVALGLEV